MTGERIVFWVLFAVTALSILIGLAVNSWLTRKHRNEPTFWEEVDR